MKGKFFARQLFIMVDQRTSTVRLTSSHTFHFLYGLLSQGAFCLLFHVHACLCLLTFSSRLSFNSLRCCHLLLLYHPIPHHERGYNRSLRLAHRIQISPGNRLAPSLSHLQRTPPSSRCAAVLSQLLFRMYPSTSRQGVLVSGLQGRHLHLSNAP